MDLTWIILIVVAIAGLVWAFPKLPAIGQVIVAVIVVVAALLILLNAADVPISV